MMFELSAAVIMKGPERNAHEKSRSTNFAGGAGLRLLEVDIDAAIMVLNRVGEQLLNVDSA